MTRRAVWYDTGVYDDGNSTLGIQPADADLTAIAALTPTNDDVIQRKAGAWTNRSMAQLGGDLTATGIWVPYSVIDAKGDLLVGSANDALDNLSVGSDGKVLMADAASTLGVKWETPASGGVSSINKTGSTALTGAVTLTGGTNVTLTQSGQDISIAASGGGGTTVATDTIWDAKGDTVAATGADAAVRVPVGTNYNTLYADSGATPGVAWYPGAPVLLYDYTVTGTDKASIDTGADTPAAGISGTSAFPALRFLEVLLYMRIDEAAITCSIDCFLNNDTSSIYDTQRLRAGNTTVIGSSNPLRSGFLFLGLGANGTASIFSHIRMAFPNYAGGVGFATFEGASGWGEHTTNMETHTYAGCYESTTAVNRIKFAPNTSGKKFKVGTRLLVYAR